jgi:predicted metal-dependent phosphoesterase TrpH
VSALFYLDLHSHSTDASDDAGGTVEGYLKWIVGRRKRGYQVDGFVLTEHRKFDPSVDYSDLAAQYDVVLLRGAELETDIGHVLVYGISGRLSAEFDFSRVDLKSFDLFRAAREFGGFAVAAHAGRPRIGLWDHIEAGINPGHVMTIEALNGGSSSEENSRAAHLAERHGFYSVGGSDAHYVSSIGRCLTAFQRQVRSIEALVEELQTGDYFPVTIEQTLTQE